MTPEQRKFFEEHVDDPKRKRVTLDDIAIEYAAVIEETEQ